MIKLLGVRAAAGLALLIILLAGCVPAGEAVVLPTETAAPLLTPTATTVWFPPTATTTPYRDLPHPSPTPQPTLQIGNPLLEDNFSKTGPWSLASSPAGSIAYGKQEISIALSEARASLTSFREQPVLSDYYLEITAEPRLCRGTDMYGVLFRVLSEGDFYRLVINCSGQMRVERVANGSASVVLDWIVSDQIPPETPGAYRLGIYAVGSDLRFYVNGRYQFGRREPVFKEGGLGLFARSMGDNAVTIGFYDLVVSRIQPLPRQDLPSTPTS